MKNLIPFLLITLIPATLSAQFIVEFDEEISVALDLDNNRPRIALPEDELPLVIWGKDAGSELYAAKFNGASFDSPIKLNPEGTEIFTSDWAGPEIAAKGEDVYVTFKLSPENTMGIYMVHSGDGGVTWSDTVRVDSVPEGFQSRFPSVEIEEDGSPVVSFMQFEGNYLDPEYRVINSDPQWNFDESVTATGDLTEGEACDCCMSHVLSDGQRQVVLFRNNHENTRTIWALISTDGGQSFSDAVEIDPTEEYSNICVSSGPHALILGNDLITVWRTKQNSLTRVKYISLDLVTLEVSGMVNVSPNVASNVHQNYPRIAGDDEFIGMVWQETKSANSDIMFSFSSPSSPNFNTARDTLNLTLTNNQVNPDLQYRNQIFHTVFQDKSDGTVKYRRGNVVKGVSVSEQDREILIYPNPTSSVFRLEGLQEIESVEIYNSLGQKIKAWLKPGTSREFSLESLPDGIYYVMINQGEYCGELLLKAN